ncbi:hypothetical protein M3J09_010812 [Ascochyta lentis]
MRRQLQPYPPLQPAPSQAHSQPPLQPTFRGPLQGPAQPTTQPISRDTLQGPSQTVSQRPSQAPLPVALPAPSLAPLQTPLQTPVSQTSSVQIKIYVYVVQCDEFGPDPDDDIGWNRIHSIHSTQSGANTAAENLTKKYLREEPGSNVEEERTDEDGNYYGYVKLYEDSFLFHKEAHVIVTVSKWFVDEVEETKNKPAEKAGTKHVKDGSKKRKR